MPHRADAANLTMMVHLSKHAERMPLLIRSYLPCLEFGRGGLAGMTELVFQVKNYEMDMCHGHCTNASIADGGRGLRCRCLSEKAWPQLQHRNLMDHARGDSHLLFTHGDMWLDLRSLFASSWLREGRTAATPLLGVGPLRVAIDAQTVDFDRREVYPGPVCIGVKEMEACQRINVTNFGFVKRNYSSPAMLRCGDVVWEWFMAAHPQCLAAALATNVSHCCIGWSDTIFLPRQSHERFRQLAKAFYGVFHHPPRGWPSPPSSRWMAIPAIPTILNAMNASGEARWAPSLPCLGGCCGDVNPRELLARRTQQQFDGTSRGPVPCAHRLPLQSRDAEAAMRCTPEGRAGAVVLGESRVHFAQFAYSVRSGLEP